MNVAPAYVEDYEEPEPAPIERSCGKRRFTSRRQAREACRKASFRLKLYDCPACGGIHVANAEKRTY